MVPTSPERVPRHSPPGANAAIRRRIEASLIYYAERPADIDARLEELDHEWDIERLLEANAATLTAAGSMLALLLDRRFAGLPMVVGTFLLQHAVQGWCPPVEVFRRLGVRTPQEIEAERYGLRMLRGDFGHVPRGLDGVDAALQAVGYWPADGALARPVSDRLANMVASRSGGAERERHAAARQG
jgi:hypothetical protein